ncbi:MAG: LuxR C-terminal-related transcriptional regulator [Mariniblastus sp.]
MDPRTASKTNPDLVGKPYFFFSNNRDSELTYISPSVKEILGYAPSSLLGRKYTDFLSDSASLNADISSCQRKRFNGDGHQESLRVAIANDGASKVLKIQTFGEQDEDGNTVLNHALAQDITETYLSEQELQLEFSELLAIESKLDAREKFVLNCVSQGKLNKVIARQLDISERTIEKVRSKLLSRFGVDSIAQVIAKSAELNTLRKVISATNIDSPNK